MSFELPNKKEIEVRYEAYRPAFNEILEKITASLKNNLHLSSNPTYKNRIKSFNSYYKKILRQKAKESGESKRLVTLTDMIGIRVICPFVEDLAEVEKQVSEIYDVKEIEKKGAEQSFREFGYESVHILIAVPEDCKPVVHTDVTVNDRKSLDITGVSDVISFDDVTINIKTVMGKMAIKGEKLHISALDETVGLLKVSGYIHGIIYITDSTKNSGFVSRLFK